MDTFNISGLRLICLSHNNLSGSLPPNMCSVIPNIEEIYLSSLTNLVGTIPHSISNYSKLTRLELSNNKLTVLIPNSLGYLTHLQDLNLGGNNLTSDSSLSFLISLTNCRDLTYLSLYLNPLNGMLPVSVGNFSTSLRIFYANSCKIKGRIPNEVGNLSRLLSLDLSGNNLVGSIPTSIGNLRNLQRFDFSNNKLTGFIVDHICKLQHLGEIYLGQNQHSGSLPNCLGNITSLREIHLGSNKLSSNIPSSLGNLKDLVVLDLSSNNMVGSLPPEIEKLKAAMLIDLSMNQFSNGIPREIGGLQNLVHLSLRHNKLQGSILDSVCNMVGLEFLDLSDNNISGTIPMSLEKLQYLKYFNVSVNKLHGEIRSGGPFKNLSSQFFNYNEALCGSSRFIVPPCPTSSKHRSSRKKEIVLFLLLGIALVFVPSTFVSFWIRYRRGKRAPQQADSLPTVTRERISYYELLQETDDLSESNLIGFGSFGSVYKGVLRSGTVTAVKVYNLQLDAAFKSFDTECEVLRGLRHRNLVKVITSCSNLDFKALVLEYMPNGSLEMHLYLHNYFLDIRQRLSIMIEVACALEYLHHGCSSPVIHCDLKTSNVLLDEDMVAHLSDFGIFKTAW
ncbi:putative WEB family protein, chloroplastic-like [Capsicum annuum]|nr:putative WEB family protein, chloroplastic-like [Capsicum annuum]